MILKTFTCFRCNKPCNYRGGNQKYCGSYREKIGCSYYVILENNRRSKKKRKPWRHFSTEYKLRNSVYQKKWRQKHPNYMYFYSRKYFGFKRVYKRKHEKI